MNRITESECRMVRVDSHPTKQLVFGIIDEAGNRVEVVRLMPRDKWLEMKIPKTARIWFEYED